MACIAVEYTGACRRRETTLNNRHRTAGVSKASQQGQGSSTVRMNCQIVVDFGPRMGERAADQDGATASGSRSRRVRRSPKRSITGAANGRLRRRGAG